MHSVRPLGPVVACLASAVVSAWLFYPGMMSPDSVEQLAQAVTADFTDWHPPIMAGVWWGLMRPFGAPPPPWSAALFLDLQLLAYWGIWALAARSLRRRSPRAVVPWLAVMAGWLPCCVGLSGVIWKDVGLAVSWGLSIMVMVEAREGAPTSRQRVAWGVVSLLAFAYGLNVRKNAIFAFPPVAGAWVATFTGSGRPSRYGLLLGASVLAAGSTLTSALMKARPVHQVQQYLLGELVELKCLEPTDDEIRFPAAVWAPGYGTGDLCTTTHPRLVASHNHDEVLFGDHPPFKVVAEEAVTAELRSGLLAAIRRQPLKWLRHRAAMWDGVMEGRFKVSSAYVLTNVLGLRVGHPQAVRRFDRCIRAFERTPLMSGYFWGAVAMMSGLTLAVRRRLRDDALPLALFTSALMYLVGYLAVAIAPSFRYLYWPVIATVAGLLLSYRPSLLPRTGPAATRPSAS